MKLLEKNRNKKRCGRERGLFSVEEAKVKRLLLVLLLKVWRWGDGWGESCACLCPSVRADAGRQASGGILVGKCD